MAVEPQWVNFPLISGVDTKTDSKQVLPGDVIVLQNAVYTNPKEYEKRNGFVPLASLSAGSSISSFQNQLIASDGQSLFSYSPKEGAAINVGSDVSCGLSTQSVYKSVSSVTQCDWAYDATSGLSCYVASTSVGTTIIIQDSVSGTTVFQVTEFPGAVAPAASRVVFFSGSFVIFTCPGSYSAGTGTITAYRIQAASPTTITTIGSIQTAAYQYDVLVSGSNLYWSANVNASSSKVGFIDSSFTNHAGVTVTGVYTTPFLSTDASNNIWVYGMIQGTKGSTANGPFKYEILNNALSSHVLALTTLDSGMAPASYDPGVATCVVSGTTGTFFYGYTQVPGITNGFTSSQPGGFVNSVTGSSSGSVGSITPIIRAVILAGRAFSFNGSTCLLVTYQSQTQSSYLVINAAGAILSQFASGSAYFGMGPSINFLPNANNFLGNQGDSQALINGYPLALVSPQSLSTGTVQIPYLIVDQITSTGGTVLGQAGINATTLSLSTPPVHVVGAQTVLSSGALPRIYDGYSIVEQGFLKYPENLTGSNSSGSGIGAPGAFGPGANTSAEYQWLATYEVLNAQGGIDRSAPAPVAVSQDISQGAATPVTFTATTTSGFTRLTSPSSLSKLSVGQVITGTGIASDTYITDIDAVNSIIYISQAATAGGTGVTITTHDTFTAFITVPTYRTTAKKNVIISLWRTIANQTTFYRVTSLAAPVLNNPLVDSIVIADNVPDPVLIGNDQLYTTGGVIENIALPPIIFAWNYQERVMAIAAENTLSVWYSQEIEQGVALQFNDSFTIAVDEQSGGLTAGCQMDDKNILFKANAIYYMVGEGPSPNGTNNDFTLPQRIPTDTGCISPRSVVLTPAGIMYQSNNGIYLLSRSLEVSYIGAPVEAYNSYTVTSALLIPSTTQVRFTISNGIELVYDYFVGKWGTFTNVSAADSCIYGGVQTYIQPGGTILQETPGEYSDNGAFVPLGFTTSWLKFGDLQGFQRVWQMYILGTYYSTHTLNVGLAYDFDPTIVQTDVVTPLPTDPLYQYRIDLQQERCEAVQITLTESQTGTTGQGLSLSGLSFKYGVKRGFNKIPAAQTYG